MTKENIKKFLKEKPGYLKWGLIKLSKMFFTEPTIVEEARNEVYHELNNEMNEAFTPGYPNILILDIETAPIKAFVWSLWKQNVYLDAIESDWFMLSWAAKWLNGDSFGEVLTSTEAQQEDDSRIVKNLWNILEKADIVITHNGDKFDIKKINARFIENNLGPVSPYKSIDTLKVVKKSFGFSSNKLEALARKFGIEGKHDTNFKLWTDCLNGSKKALDTMLKYNIQDVDILELIYIKLRPWIKNHPNINLYLLDDKMKCTNCNSSDLEEVSPSYSSVSKYKSYRCKSCGTILRERKSMLSTEENKLILTQVK
jgi:hypothetical protein